MGGELEKLCNWLHACPLPVGRIKIIDEKKKK